MSGHAAIPHVAKECMLLILSTEGFDLDTHTTCSFIKADDSRIAQYHTS